MKRTDEKECNMTDDPKTDGYLLRVKAGGGKFTEHLFALERAC